MGKAISVRSIMTKRFKLLPFKDEWYDSFGRIELSGSMIIWGQSGSGKTSLSMQFAKYVSQFSRVLYNSLEMGYSPTLQDAFARIGMDEVKRRLILVKEPLEELTQRLLVKKSPNVVIIDSFQYTGLTYKDYTVLKDDFPNKLFVYISHANGKEPKGSAAQSVRYDADIKVYCEGHKAFVSSRYGGGKPFIIWPEGANEYWKDF
ncbi:MAG: hypothetical protein HC896_00435 [Bacteroidales bacterium]|nr:hypothetical protein [Bacteroidales bacterium]